jgi:hypothetical protein
VESCLKSNQLLFGYKYGYFQGREQRAIEGAVIYR